MLEQQEPQEASSYREVVAYGPEPDAYDLDRVVSTARQHDPNLAQDIAVALATEAYGLLRDLGGPDAPALARALMERHGDLGVSELNAVAKATVDLFEGDL